MQCEQVCRAEGQSQRPHSTRQLREPADVAGIGGVPALTQGLALCCGHVFKHLLRSVPQGVVRHCLITRGWRVTPGQPVNQIYVVEDQVAAITTTRRHQSPEVDDVVLWVARNQARHALQGQRLNLSPLRVCLPAFGADLNAKVRPTPAVQPPRQQPMLAVGVGRVEDRHGLQQRALA